MFGKFSEKVAKAVGERTDYGISINQSEVLAEARRFLQWHSLSELFPYESYDEESGIYLNKKSKGFILEIGSFTGTNDNLEREISGIFKTVLPAGYNIQVMLFASPKIGYYLDNWVDARYQASEFLKEMASKRVEFFKKKALEGTGQARIRDLRIFVSVSTGLKNQEISDIESVKETVQGMLATTGTGLGDVAPHGLIRVLDEIFNYDDTISESEKRWNKYQDISSQIIDIANRYQLNDDSMVLNRGEREYRAYSVRRFPDRWSLGMMDRLIGDSYRDLLNISCPFIVQYGTHIVDSKILKNGILAKASKLEAQASSILGNWIPSLVRESQELGYVRARLDNGEDRLVKTHYQVILMDKPERMRQSEQSLYSLYISNRWRLGIDKYIVLPSLLSILPMSWGDGMQKDMSYFKRMRTTISEEPISLLPIRGEFKGTRTPGMLLTGRRGQIIWWSPFDGMSNFNVCVVGTTGSGKSFFMQELCQQILSLAGKVYVLDKGRSFEKLVLISKGQFLDFNRKAKICINPFTTIDATDEDAIEDSLSILAPIISQMAGLKEGTTDKEDNIISEGLRVIWERKKNDAMIDDLVNWLEKEKDHTDAKNLATKLYRYRRGGSYGMYFNGKANIDLDDNFVVTELGDLQYKEGLLLVIVKMVLLMISNKIVLVGDRSIKKAIIFDEAWQLLQGHAGAKFVDELVRTVRKHGGAVVCGTQGIDDFFKNEGSEAAYNFAEHLVIFQQDQDTLKRLVDKGRISIVPGEDTILTTLKTEPGKYAEMMIKSRVYRFAARLMVDNFSKILYSTKDTEYQAVKDLIDRGIEVKDAILQVTKEVYGHE